MKTTILIILITPLAAAGGLTLSGCKPAEPAEPAKEVFEEPTTPEEKAFVQEARELGTQLHTVAQKVESLPLAKEEKQRRYEPVYDQIEGFIFRRLADYTNRISSITVLYSHPAVECTIIVRDGPEEELAKIKRAADTCVGRIIEKLPMVKYLMIKNEN